MRSRERCESRRPRIISLDRYVVSTSGRVFINSALGCASRCAYCYIEDYGLTHSPDIATFSGMDLVAYLGTLPGFDGGRHGTLLSFGCFSESFARPQISKTIELIGAASKLGNPIQIATKIKITGTIAAALKEASRYRNQIGAFISLTTFTRWRKLEPGTASPQRRLEGFAELQRAEVPACLYIKPFLLGVTDKESEVISRAILVHGIESVVVGELFTTTRIESILGEHSLSVRVPGAEKRPFPVPGVLGLEAQDVSNEMETFAAKLMENTRSKVFFHSTEAVSKWLVL